MATLADRTRTIGAEESWELPKNRSFLSKMGKLARDNPIGAL